LSMVARMAELCHLDGTRPTTCARQCTWRSALAPAASSAPGANVYVVAPVFFAVTPPSVTTKSGTGEPGVAWVTWRVTVTGEPVEKGTLREVCIPVAGS